MKNLLRRDWAHKRECFDYAKDKSSVNHHWTRQIYSVLQEGRTLKAYQELLAAHRVGSQK